MPAPLTKALLLEEVASPGAIAEALFVSVTADVPLVHALTDTGAVTPDVLERYLARSDAPVLHKVAPHTGLVARLPPGLCERLLAIPVRHDAITGTVDVVVADPNDPLAAREIGFCLGAPVRVVRAPVPAIEEALRLLRGRSRPPPAREEVYDSRPLGSVPPAPRRSVTVPPPQPDLAASSEVFSAPLAGRRARPERSPSKASRATPPWGTPIHNAKTKGAPSDPPRSGLGSEIPIPLTRRTFSAVSGGTQRPPPLVNPAASKLGEGYPVDPGVLRAVVEVQTERVSAPPPGPIPGPPPVPSGGTFAAYAPELPVADIGGILAALRAAGSRDEALELLLTGARMLAFKVALFVVKRAGYVGWACTPEFGDRASLQAVTIAHEAPSVFAEAVREGLYLGSIRHSEAHARLLAVMRGATRDVALVPVRVSGKPAVIVVADELGDTMIATRKLEELARAAGEALGRVVRMRR